MGTILDELSAYARRRVEEKEKVLPCDRLRERAFSLPGRDFVFEKALGYGISVAEDIRFICECKKASPSKGVIAEDFPYLDIAEDYEKAGAAAISVLTEPKWFLGSDRYLEEIAGKVSIPVLRKDFTVSEYMIYEAAVMGASAVLLICAILSDEELRSFRETADSLGLSCLVEAHDEEEVRRAEASGARIIGVNNRNLKDFTVDIENSIRLRELVPRETAVFVAESGIRDHGDIKKLLDNGVQAVLVGETLMRAKDKKQMLDELRGLC